MKPVFLIPGFTASDLAILSTGQRIWFDTNVAALVGLGAMRLADNGVDPGPPDGEQMGHSLDPQPPWPAIVQLLKSQMAASVWSFQVLNYDWRLDLTTIGNALAANIRGSVDPAEPATLVAHSAGGLVATIAWASLVQSNQSNLVRRIITIGTPYQGSYGAIQWLTGVSPTVQELRAVSVAFGNLTGFNPVEWTLSFLNGIALTWPAFYELFPALDVPEEQGDPFRTFLYESATYPALADPSQAWLDFARQIWQPRIKGFGTSPPQWVLTTVAGSGIATPNRLLTGAIPLNLNDLGTTVDGDGVVTVTSATKSPGLNLFVSGEHNSIPLGLAINGKLADLILDPRGPISPTPVPVFDKLAILQNVTAPPQSDYVSGLVCIGGG